MNIMSEVSPISVGASLIFLVIQNMLVSCQMVCAFLVENPHSWIPNAFNPQTFFPTQPTSFLEGHVG